MLRNAMIALIAVASLTLLPSNAASARGGGVGMHGGGCHFGGGHFGGGHFGHFGGFHHRFDHFGGVGFYPVPLYDYYPYESYPYEGDCYLVRQRVRTHHGWRLRTVRVC